MYIHTMIGHACQEEIIVHWLIVYFFLSPLRIVHSYGDVTIANEGLQNLPGKDSRYAQHSWPLSWGRGGGGVYKGIPIMGKGGGEKNVKKRRGP